MNELTDLEQKILNKFVKIGLDFLNEFAQPKFGLCSDRTCLRCRLQDIIDEIVKLKENEE